MKTGLKQELSQQHITYGASGDRYQHLFLPQMKSGGNGYRDHFGYAVGSGCELRAPETVNDQHAEYGAGQDLAKVPYESGRCFFGREDQKWKKSGKHCAKNT